ncbi:hypothetical protein JYU34_000823 [Plutella xylostella]|uniref:Uncharacterized protein n=1 Tax=Plutella xylostella TaxID=51655 RepID=A0ABQ7R8P5_PLUXY|nr:hypothetical protein JYU34_000823 [Plutella xylostella]
MMREGVAILCLRIHLAQLDLAGLMETTSDTCHVSVPTPPAPGCARPRPRPVRLAAAEPARGARATRAAAPPGDAAATRHQSITHYFCGLHPKMKVSCAIAPPRLHSCRTELIALKIRLHFGRVSSCIHLAPHTHWLD